MSGRFFKRICPKFWRWCKLWQLFGSPQTIGTLKRDLFGDPPWVTMLVAEADGILAGYVVLSRQIRLHAGERGMDLHHFFVHQEWRGRGVGRRLIKTSIDLAEQLSCSYLTVATTVENKKAQQIYLAAGFALASPNGVRFRRQLEKGGKKNQG